MQNTNDNQTKPNEEVEEIEDSIVVQTLEDDNAQLDLERIASEGSVPNVDESASQTETTQEHKKPRSQKRIRELTKRNRELEEELKAKSTAEKGNESGNSNKTLPDINDFETFEEYDVAMQQHTKDSNNNESGQHENSTEEQNRTKEEAKTVLEEEATFRELDDLTFEVKDKYQDFNEVVTNPDLNITLGLMKSLIDFEDNAGELLYRLANDKKTLNEIASLSEKEQYKRLVLMENDINNNVSMQARTIRGSKAPEPILPVNGSGNNARSINDDDLSQEDMNSFVSAKGVATKGGWL